MAFEIWKDTTSPIVDDVVAIGGVAQDLSNATIKFRMRAEGSSTLKVDHAASFKTDGTDGAWEYEWQTGDTDTPGDYLGWLHVTLSGGATQDTPEFPVTVLDHDLSSGALCSVADVREFMSWPAEDRTRDRLIQSLILGASDRMLNEAGREFAPKTTNATRRFRLDPSKTIRESGRLLWLVDFGHRQDLNAEGNTTVVVKLNPETASPATLTELDHFVFEPSDGGVDNVYDRMKLSPYAFGLDGIVLDSDVFCRFGYAYLDVTADWGYPSVPHGVNDLARKVIAAWLQRDVSALLPPGFSVADSTQPPAPAGFDLPLFAVRGLNNWRRHVVF